MPISKQKANKVALYYYNNNCNTEVTAKHFNILPESVGRYVRESKGNTGVPKVLVLDIETSLMEVYVWGCWKQRITPKQIKKPRFILCWAAKWFNDPHVMSDCVTADEAERRDDKRIMKSVWDKMNEADIIIGHNVKKFDLKRIKWAFLKHGMMPPSSSTPLDTLSIMKKEFDAELNALSFLAGMNGLNLTEEKMETQYELWIGCNNAEQEQLDYLVKYCKQDVVTEQELYMTIRPYATFHPNFGLYATFADSLVCSKCGSINVELNGDYTTAMNQYDEYRCRECKSLIRGWRGITYKEKKHLTRSVAR